MNTKNLHEFRFTATLTIYLKNIARLRFCSLFLKKLPDFETLYLLRAGVQNISPCSITNINLLFLKIKTTLRWRFDSFWQPCGRFGGRLPGVSFLWFIVLRKHLTEALYWGWFGFLRLLIIPWSRVELMRRTINFVGRCVARIFGFYLWWDRLSFFELFLIS